MHYNELKDTVFSERHLNMIWYDRGV